MVDHSLEAELERLGPEDLRERVLALHGHLSSCRTAASMTRRRAQAAEARLAKAAPFVAELNVWLGDDSMTGLGPYLDDLVRLLDVLDPPEVSDGETDPEILTRLRAEAHESDNQLGWDFDRVLSDVEARVFRAWVYGRAHSPHTPTEGAA